MTYPINIIKNQLPTQKGYSVEGFTSLSSLTRLGCEENYAASLPKNKAIVSEKHLSELFDATIMPLADRSFIDRVSWEDSLEFIGLKKTLMANKKLGTAQAAAYEYVGAYATPKTAPTTSEFILPHFGGFNDTVEGFVMENAVSEHCNDDDFDASHYAPFGEAYASQLTSVMRKQFSRLTDRVSFESMQYVRIISPSYYNFVNDKILATIDTSALGVMLSIMLDDDAMHSRLRGDVVNDHASRDGYFSLTSPILSSWGGVETWHKGQSSTLVRSFIEAHGLDETPILHSFEQSEQFYKALTDHNSK